MMAYKSHHQLKIVFLAKYLLPLNFYPILLLPKPAQLRPADAGQAVPVRAWRKLASQAHAGQDVLALAWPCQAQGRGALAQARVNWGKLW